MGKEDHNEASEPDLWPVLIRIDDVIVLTESVIKLAAPASAIAQV